jgi:hypothetical protein
MLFDAVVELGQPLFQRSLDLGLWCAWFLRPDPRPVRADRVGRGIGVGRLGFDDRVRLEFRHLLAC